MSNRSLRAIDVIITFAVLFFNCAAGAPAWTIPMIAAALFWNYVTGARRIYRPDHGGSRPE